jgi:DNA polymerase III alpha subunit
MNTDKFGQQIYNENDLCDLLLQDPSRTLNNVLVQNPITFTDIVANIPKLIEYHSENISVKEFDSRNQDNWYIPEQYKDFDIAKFILDQCSNEQELQRAGAELILFQEREMFPMLRYLKYLVDTMRKNNVVWGVGRGSSVASFVLFLLGVHKINSVYYDLSIDEFLK